MIPSKKGDIAIAAMTALAGYIIIQPVPAGCMLGRNAIPERTGTAISDLTEYDKRYKINSEQKSNIFLVLFWR